MNSTIQLILFYAKMGKHFDDTLGNMNIQNTVDFTHEQNIQVQGVFVWTLKFNKFL
jgi:hypothetical protein